MIDLLPPNATAQERARASVSQRITDIDVPIKDLYNPWKCPLRMLPYLAWAHNVQAWNANWPELTKRRVIDASWDVHAHKGTNSAIHTALASLGIEARLTEWFDRAPEGERGTFTLEALLTEEMGIGGNVLINPELIQDIYRSIDSAKRGSQHYTMSVGALSGTNQTFASVGAVALNKQAELKAIHKPYAAQQTLASGGTAALAKSAKLERLSPNSSGKTVLAGAATVGHIKTTMLKRLTPGGVGATRLAGAGVFARQQHNLFKASPVNGTGSSRLNGGLNTSQQHHFALLSKQTATAITNRIAGAVRVHISAKLTGVYS